MEDIAPIPEAELNAEAIKFGQHYIKTQLPESTDLATKTQVLNHAVRSFFAGVRWYEKTVDGFYGGWRSQIGPKS